MNRLLVLSLVLACSRSRPEPPVDLKSHAWACYQYIGDRSHCEIDPEKCVAAQAKVPVDYKPGECVRVEAVWCYERPGDEPVEDMPADRPWNDGTIYRWCYKSPGECAAHSPGCSEQH